MTMDVSDGGGSEVNVIWRSHVHQLSQSLTVHLSVIFLPEFFLDQDASYSSVKYFTGIFTGSDVSEMNFETEGSSRCALIRQSCCHCWGMSSCLAVIFWVFAHAHTHTYSRAHTHCLSVMSPPAPLTPLLYSPAVCGFRVCRGLAGCSCIVI